MNILEGKMRLKGDEKVAIINGRFNHIITDRLVEGARDAFIRHGGDDNNLDLILVPGAFEIPFALTKALENGKYDAVCCVGAVIRGATPHFDYISAEATKGIASCNHETRYPRIKRGPYHRHYRAGYRKSRKQGREIKVRKL